MAKKPPENKEIDARVLARRQKDLDGFIEQHQEILDKRAVKYAAEIAPFWKRVGSNITKEIRAIYQEVQDAQGVPIEKNPIDAAKYRNMQRQIARLRNLQRQLVDMMGTEEQKAKMDRNLAYSYSEAYYFHAFGLEQAAKVALNVPILTQGHVIGVLINPWLPDGNTYSDRLRANTQYLAGKMVKTLEEAMGSGWSINRTAREIQNNAQEGYYNAVRLARTEINRAAAQGANHVYMQNADIMDGKRWNAVLDARTAPKDAQNDGNTFDLAYDTPEMPGEPGKRIPNHPNCRCKWSPILSALGISTKERIARGAGDSKQEFGERIYTEARTYKEYAEQRGLPNIDDLVRNEDPRRYLRRGETLADVPTNFFDPFQPIKTAAKVFTAVEAAQIANVGNAFTAASSIEEANAWAMQNLPIEKADYTGMDLEYVNDLNEQLHSLFAKYPEINNLKFIGASDVQDEILHKVLIEKQVEAMQKRFPAIDKETVRSMVAGNVEKPKIDPRAYAQAVGNEGGGSAGVGFNVKLTNKYRRLQDEIAKNVADGWAPEGTEDPVGLLVHEFGHMIDYFITDKGKRGKYLQPIIDEALNDRKLKQELSEYGTYNDMEFVAEAFLEYILNPNPRKYARLVGEAIENTLDDIRKGR